MITSNVLKKIIKKYKIVEKQYIELDLINKIHSQENISIKDLQYLFQISNSTMYNLRKCRQTKTKLDFNKSVGIKNKEILTKTVINYEDFNNLKNKLNVKNYSLVGMLGISEYSYNKMKNDITYKVIIKDTYIKYIVDLIKIDLKYQTQTSCYCSIRKIQNICKKRGITIKQFAEYYNSNSKHYKFNLMIIEKSSKGFWISSDTKISNEFISENYTEIMLRLNKIVKRFSFMINCNFYNEDLVSETFTELYLKCGNVVQNFYFDTNVLFNILMAKAKYIMFNIYMKKYKNQNTISYYSLCEETDIDRLDILKDNTYDPQNLLD